ncbi:hypothetical protein DL96DRAFT_1619802 [Flagelloscypha sp. PMI_526]|nr:hypothetical protein DL96DRAFT_1619802 [Flagelloscypha sp. PMI_526]
MYLDPSLVCSQTLCANCLGCTPDIIICRKCQHALPIRLEAEFPISSDWNTWPEPSSLPQVRQQIQLARRELSRYTSLIAQLSSVSKVLSQYIEYQKSRCSPIHILPPELLESIFVAVCEEEFFDPAVFTFPKHAIALSHVSRTFRRIAFSSPALWTKLTLGSPYFGHLGPKGSISAQLYFRTEDRQQELLDILRQALKRSVTAPLTIDIPFVGAGIEDSWKIPFIDLLVQESFRWKSLSLDLMSSTWLSKCTKGFPTLESVRIYGFGPPNDDAAIVSSLSHALRNAPNLRSIDTSQTGIHPVRFKLHDQQLAQLNSLLFEEYGPEGTVSLPWSTQLQNLTTLHISGPLHLSHPVELPMLTALTASAFNSPPILFSNLRIPKLTTFKIRQADISADNTAQFCQMLLNSQPPIRDLEVSSSAFKPNEVHELLSVVPTLRTLTMTSCSQLRLNIGTLQSLADGLILPCLTKVHLEMFLSVPPTDGDEEALVAFLEARFRARKDPLTQARLYVDREQSGPSSPFEHDHLMRMRTLKREGFDIEVALQHATFWQLQEGSSYLYWNGKGGKIRLGEISVL